MITASLSLVCLLLGVYYSLACTQLGASLLYFWKPEGDFLLRKRSSFKVCSPIWEISNSILILALVSFLFLFHHQIQITVRSLRSTLIVALAVFIVRAGAYCYVHFFIKNRPLPVGLAILLILTFLAIPLIIGAAGIYMLTGVSFWQTHASITMSVALLLGTISMSLAFIWYQLHRFTPRLLRMLARSCVASFCIVSAIPLQITINHAQGHLLRGPYDILILLLSAIAIAQVGLWLLHRESMILLYLSGVVVCAPILWGLANRPYLFFPNASLSQAYGYSTEAKLIYVVIVACLIVAVTMNLISEKLFPPKLRIGKLL
jgi:hypothetical protein